MTTWAIRNACAVTPSSIIDDATIVAEDGVIVSIVERGAAPIHCIDARGAFCLPGLIDSHSDGLEKELAPRPGAHFPAAFALQSFEGRVRAAAVTTVYHGIGFEEDERKERTIAQAIELSDAIQHRRTGGHAMIDHRLLYRLDARDPAGLTALTHRLPTDDHADALPLVSFEDHTPGQGQYQDTSYFVQWLVGSKHITEAEAIAQVAERRRQRDLHLDQRSLAAAWLGDEAREGRIRLMAHDPANHEDVAAAVSISALVAEFPTTIESARAAIESGLTTVMGAPNVLRGRSHSGNVSARELIANGLCTGLASDYLPSTMLAAAFVLAEQNVVALPDAVRLVTDGPARVVGLADRGRLEAGYRADAALVTVDHHWPTVRAVLTAANHDHATAQVGRLTGSNR
ncbi:MAG: alpha-D-ribose 1-methylphosphonate 5-triphosphate diphosphatase [Acidimicrobiia bacterium]